MRIWILDVECTMKNMFQPSKTADATVLSILSQLPLSSNGRVSLWFKKRFVVFQEVCFARKPIHLCCLIRNRLKVSRPCCLLEVFVSFKNDPCFVTLSLDASYSLANPNALIHVPVTGSKHIRSRLYLLSSFQHYPTRLLLSIFQIFNRSCLKPIISLARAGHIAAIISNKLFSV